MSEQKQRKTKSGITANCSPEFTEQYRQHCNVLPGDWTGSSRVKALAEADMECGDLLALAAQKKQSDLLRRELSVVLYVLLAAMGRVGSSDTALKLVEQYLAGAFHEGVQQ